MPLFATLFPRKGRARTCIPACLLTGLVWGSASAALSPTPVPLENELDKTSYSIGANVGKNLKTQSIAINTEAFLWGLQEGIAGKYTGMKEQDIEQQLITLQQKMVEAEHQKRKAAAEDNKQKSTLFLEENKKRSGVTTLASGLQYEIVKSGAADGTPPTETDTVVTHYKGTLIDGTEFDSSYSRGQPASFPVNAVIPGWTEALKKMRPGDHWKLYVPSHLAYGEQGTGPKIGPNQALIFEIELISVKKPERKAP